MNIDLCFPTFLFVQGCIWIVFDLIMDKFSMISWLEKFNFRLCPVFVAIRAAIFGSSLSHDLFHDLLHNLVQVSHRAATTRHSGR